MLGLSWTELLVIGVVALIVIGPQELPTVMKKVGQFVGQIRRMGNEFQRELNRTTGLDEVKNLRNAISDPLRKTADEIRKEFNTMTATGPKPSGAIKPKDPKAESVADEIKAIAGMTGEGDAEGQGDPQKPATATQPALAAAANPAVATQPAQPARRRKAASADPVAPRPRRKAAARTAEAPAAAEPAAEAAKPVTPKRRKATPAAAPASAEAAPTPRRRTSRKAMELEADAAAPAADTPAPANAAEEAPKPARRRRKTAESGDAN
jgi:sec-independent protein translocase protein TatB